MHGLLTLLIREPKLFSPWPAGHGKIAWQLTDLVYLADSLMHIHSLATISFAGLQGTMKLGRMAKSLASIVNPKRKEKGLLPRPVIHLISCWFLVFHWFI